MKADGPPTNPVLFACLFGSGAAALICEIVWLRHFAPTGPDRVRALGGADRVLRWSRARVVRWRPPLPAARGIVFPVLRSICGMGVMVMPARATVAPLRNPDDAGGQAAGSGGGRGRCAARAPGRLNLLAQGLELALGLLAQLSLGRTHRDGPLDVDEREIEPPDHHVRGGEIVPGREGLGLETRGPFEVTHRALGVAARQACSPAVHERIREGRP